MSIRIDGTNTAANPGITGADTDTGLQFGTNEVSIVTDGTARATVDSDGDLGIGTASPSALLHIAKSGGNAKLLIQRSNTAADTNDYGSILWQSSAGNNNALIGAARHSAENDAYMFFSTASGGSLQEELRIQSAGGISFNGDTAAANALSDYEEGTYTPTINTTTTPITGITYTAQNGYYVKVGKIVYVSMWITWSSRTNTSGTTASISLPFASYNSSGYRGAIHVSTENCTYNGYGFDSGSTRNIGAMAGTHLNQNVSYMEISFTGKNGGGWGSGGISVNGLGANGGNMQLSGTYMAQ